MDGILVLREGGQPVWKVLWQGRMCSPTWRESGPAMAYYEALCAGTRQPEYHGEEPHCNHPGGCYKPPLPF